MVTITLHCQSDTLVRNGHAGHPRLPISCSMQRVRWFSAILASRWESATAPPLTSQNAAGTPLYMAPEQIRHQPRHQSDHYAASDYGLGVALWGTSVSGPWQAVFAQHLHQASPSLCACLSHLSWKMPSLGR